MTSNHQQSEHPWRYEGVDEAQTVLLAMLARFFAGQQQERVSYGNKTMDEEDLDVCEEGIARVDELNSDATDDPSVLRKRLLNRLSELLARRREASSISGCILVDLESSAVIYAFRNSGFEEKNEDREFLNELSSALADLRKGFTARKERKLFKLILSYYKHRLASHAQVLWTLLSKTLESKNKVLPRGAAVLKQLRSLRRTCGRFGRNPDNIDRLVHISTEAYNMSRQPNTKSLLAVMDSRLKVGCIMKELRFIARIRTIHNVLVECAKKLPFIEDMKIECIGLHQDQLGPTTTINYAKEGVKTLLNGFSISIPAVLRWLGTDHHLQREYEKKLILHVEMQIIFFLLRPENSGLSPFEYIGMSRGPCFMCGKFLEAYATYATRPGHGQIHSPWTLPHSSVVRRNCGLKVHTALQAVLRELAVKLKSPSQRRLVPRAESAIASSYTATSTPRSTQNHDEARMMVHLSERLRRLYFAPNPSGERMPINAILQN